MRKGNLMDEITYELICDDCGSEYSIVQTVDIDSDDELPIYCPFCGAGVDVDNIEEEDDEFEELDKYLEEEDIEDLDFDVD